MVTDLSILEVIVDADRSSWGKRQARLRGDYKSGDLESLNEAGPTKGL